MATDRTFNAMLNDHLNYKLLKEEHLKRDWLLSNVDRDEGAKGGDIPVPFKGKQASNIEYGSLPDSTDIGESEYVRGSITSFKEVWGTIKLNHRDLIEHDGKITEDSFLKVWPDELDDFMDFMKMRVSCTMLNGYAAKLTSDGTAGGSVTVDHPERFTLKEKVYVDDDNSAVSSVGYIQSINMETGVMTIDTTRAGGTDRDLSAYTTAQNAKIYYSGTQPGTALGFTSLRDQVLSSANGGASTLFGQTKTDYPYLQAVGQSGSAFTENNILEGVFNKWVTIRNRCAGRPNQAIMSFKNFAAIMKCLEIGKGAYHIVQDSRKVSAYGWEEVQILGPAGALKCVAVQEMEDDVIFIMPELKKVARFHTNGWFRTHKTPDGNMFYTTRSTSGYYYLIDNCLYGELALFAPSSCGYIYSISFSLSES